MPYTSQSDLCNAIFELLISIDPQDFIPSAIFELEAQPAIQGNYIIYKITQDSAADNFYDQEHPLKVMLELDIYVPKFSFNPQNPNGGTQNLRRISDLFYASLAYQPIPDVPGYSNLKINPVERGKPEVESDRLCFRQVYLVTGSSQYN